MKFMPCFRRAIAILVFALLTAGAAQALPMLSIRPALTVPEAGFLLDAWDSLVSRLRALAKPQPKAGCGMDPDGKPVSCK
jgi:hypothetical protein